MADAFVAHDWVDRIGAPSLFDLSNDKLRRNIHLLWETNDTPKHILLPLVALVHNPEQLGAIEESSPHLKGELGVFWLRMIKKNIAGWENMLFKNRLHSDGSPWTEAEVVEKATYRTYRNCVKKMKQEDAAAIAQLRQAVGQASAAQRDKETRVIAKLPPGYFRPKKRTGHGYDGTSGVPQTGELRFGGGSRTKTTTAQGVMTKIRRANKEASFARRGGALSTPTHLLKDKAVFLPPGVDKRFEVPQSSSRRPNSIRLTARPTSFVATTRLSAQASPSRLLSSTRLSSSTSKLQTSSSSPTKPSQSSAINEARSTNNMNGSRSSATNVAVQPTRPLPHHSSPATSALPGLRKRPPPTVLMPAKRRRLDQ